MPESTPVPLNVSTNNLTPSRPRAGRNWGFTLVEVMVSITIVSVLAAGAIAAMQNVKRQAIATTVVNDLRTFAAAFDVYSHENGRWPAEADVGVVPPEMATRINATAWLRTTPIGGHYNWDYNQMHGGTRYRAAIAISSATGADVIEDVDLWQAVDRLVDGGDLTKGNFKIGADGEPVYIIAP